VREIAEIRERVLRDLPWQTFVIVEFYRVKCPRCGLKVEEVPQMPGKAPFSKDFEDAVGLACESAAPWQVARQFGLAASTIRAIDLRYLELGEEAAPECKIVFDKFHVMQHANEPVDEVRRAEVFRKGGRRRGVVKGKRWLLLTRWVNLDGKKQSLDRLWTYIYEAAARRYLHSWIDQLKWQRRKPFQDLALMLLRHQEGLLNYCRTKVPFGVVEAVNGNIKPLIRQGRGYRNLRYLPLKAQRTAALRLEVVVLRGAALVQAPSHSRAEPLLQTADNLCYPL
jgi:hypothetical protein